MALQRVIVSIATVHNMPMKDVAKCRLRVIT